MINKYLTPLCLGWWYQDDGHLKKDKGIPRKIILSTDSFSKHENRYLAKILYDKYQFCFKVDAQNRLILYDQPQIYYFLLLIRPFIHPSMERKDLSFTEFIPFKTNKRTTIYLPAYVNINYPTKDIHNLLLKLRIIIKLLRLEENNKLFFQTSILSMLNNEQAVKSYQFTSKAPGSIKDSPIHDRT